MASLINIGRDSNGVYSQQDSARCKPHKRRNNDSLRRRFPGVLFQEKIKLVA